MLYLSFFLLIFSLDFNEFLIAYLSVLSYFYPTIFLEKLYHLLISKIDSRSRGSLQIFVYEIISSQPILRVAHYYKTKYISSSVMGTET